MYAWLKATFSKLLRKSDVAVAIHFALEPWTTLLLFAEDGSRWTTPPPNARCAPSRWYGRPTCSRGRMQAAKLNEIDPGLIQ
jgi:hypothetical protein